MGRARARNTLEATETPGRPSRVTWLGVTGGHLKRMIMYDVCLIYDRLPRCVDRGNSLPWTVSFLALQGLRPLILGPVRMVEEARKCFVFAPFPTILGISPPRREILYYDGMSSMAHSIPSTRPHRRIRGPLRANPSPVMARTAEEVRRLRPGPFGHCLQRRGSCYVVVSGCYR